LNKTKIYILGQITSYKKIPPTKFYLTPALHAF
jgi:hypothetical protein